MLQLFFLFSLTAVTTWMPQAQVEEIQACEISPTPLPNTWNEIAQETLGVTIQPKKKRSRKRNKKNVEEYVAAEGQTDQAETNQEDGKALNSLQGKN